MPRAARVRAESGVYHVMVRGINKQKIFLHAHDKARYLDALWRAKEGSKCSIYAYCLMSNHVHLLLSEGDETIGEVMKRIGSSYALGFNQKYERIGHLFQDRFMSEPVETDDYMLAALRYIHQNPVKAGMVTACDEYMWSSYIAYTLNKECPVGLTDVDLVLGLVGGVKEFRDFHQAEGMYRFEYDDGVRASDAAVLVLLDSLLAGVSPSALQTMDEDNRDRTIRGLKNLTGASERQIARLCGLPRHVVHRALS
ncbi:MAG: hypothetical protein DDT35_01440 [Firmicutes bacterium]|nr:hypothetical protein [Bacillota bacterium]